MKECFSLSLCSRVAGETRVPSSAADIRRSDALENGIRLLLQPRSLHQRTHTHTPAPASLTQRLQTDTRLIIKDSGENDVHVHRTRVCL